MALITCENISLAYENNVVLSDLSFSVHTGDYLCIVGENGSGKSTLIKALLSFKRPLCGSIRFGDSLRQNEIGYLPQQTRRTKRFSRQCMGGSTIRLHESKRVLPFLFRCPASPSPGKSGKAGSVGSAPPLLSGAFRRPAAEGFAGAGTMRHT